MKNKILAINNTFDELSLIKKMLQNEYTILSADSTKQTLEAIASNNDIDLILINTASFHLDGYQLCKELKSNEHFHHIPIILLTYIDDYLKCFDFGADDYAIKPIHSKEFLPKITTHIALKKHQENGKYTNSTTDQQNFISFFQSFEKTLHQWKQPLAIIELNCSNLQLELMMDSCDMLEIESSLKSISEQVSELSDAIDNFRKLLINYIPDNT